MSAISRASQDCCVPVTELPIPRADCTTPDARRRAPQKPYADSSTPSHPERAEVVLAIDRWNNEGGFVADVDAGLNSWLLRRSPSLDG
jgi:hypothetical protein